MNTQNQSNHSLFFALLSLAIGGFCIGTTEFAAMGLLQEIASNLNISIPSAGHLISAYALGVLVGAPVFAILGARIPKKKFLIALMLFYGLANITTAFVHSYDIILLSRFVAGLPHGAYFGIAALVAAELAGPKRRATAVARMMLGLTVANVIGVPLATWIGQNFGWQAGFGFSGTVAFITIAAILFFVPNIAIKDNESILEELRGLKNINMWLTLAVGAIGFGGIFAVYSYISPILLNYTHLRNDLIPVVLAIWGIGMVCSNFVSGYFADKNLTKTTIGILICSTLSFCIALMMMGNIYTAVLALFLIGISVMGLATTLQTRLMDVAGNAQSLAATLNHSALNFANALGAFLGGWALNKNLGWLSPIWIAIVLTLGGLIIFLIALKVEKRTRIH
ncbi:MFS transporter [Acinetobacter boissieri]|uniref:MFS transporter, DHA1 family, inner membrane transport protein n=1 Tax=Acinetobacter boissieri TaxID=1219383 RepID=A0A1G6GUR7_9GAMM|nr:MFS transporter [Acinetobacter boissieri]SDB85780.1 MFS transporter, DHA1 family, inner membrane transport protein [Acinetobacter boissieri]